MINSTRNPKFHPKWVKSCDFDFKLIKKLAQKVKLFTKSGTFFQRSLLDRFGGVESGKEYSFDISIAAFEGLRGKSCG
jgi:hypothetical protein